MRFAAHRESIREEQFHERVLLKTM